MNGSELGDGDLAQAVRPPERPIERPAPPTSGPPRPERARQPALRRHELGEALRTLSRVFDTLETTQLQCSALEAERSASQVDTEKMLENAFARIEDLEAVVAGLMRIVAKYDSLLSLSNGRRHEAEQRAVDAEIRVRETERGASQAVERLYRYMADALQTGR